MKVYIIYSLASSEDPSIVRYIGQTIKPLSQRLSMHLHKAYKETNHRACWIRSEIKKGNKILINFLEQVDETNWADKEKEYIKTYRELGFKLVNTTDGGESANGYKHTELTKHKISESLRKRIRKPVSEDTKQKIREGVIKHQLINGHPKGMLGKKHTVESIDKMLFSKGQQRKPKSK
jgi:group I intron endonuclease